MPWVYKNRDGQIIEGNRDELKQACENDYQTGATGQYLFYSPYSQEYYQTSDEAPEYKRNTYFDAKDGQKYMVAKSGKLYPIEVDAKGNYRIKQETVNKVKSNLTNRITDSDVTNNIANGKNNNIYQHAKEKRNINKENIPSDGNNHAQHIIGKAAATNKQHFGHESSKEMENYAKDYRYDPKNPDNAVFMNEYNLAISNMKQMKQVCSGHLRDLWTEMHKPGKTSQEMMNLSAAYNQVYAQYDEICDAQKKLRDPRHYIKSQVDAVNNKTRTHGMKKDENGNDVYDWSEENANKYASLNNINSYIQSGGAPAKKNVWANIGGWISNTAKNMPKPDMDGDLSHTAPTEAGNRIVNALTGGVGKDPSNKTAWDRANANLQQQQAAQEQKNAQQLTQQGTSNYRVEAEKDAVANAQQQNKQNVEAIYNVGAGNAALARKTAEANYDDRRNFNAQQFDKGIEAGRVANEGQQQANATRQVADADDYQYNQTQNFNDTSSSLSMGGYNTTWKNTTPPPPVEKEEPQVQEEKGEDPITVEAAGEKPEAPNQQSLEYLMPIYQGIDSYAKSFEKTGNPVSNNEYKVVNNGDGTFTISDANNVGHLKVSYPRSATGGLFMKTIDFGHPQVKEAAENGAYWGNTEAATAARQKADQLTVAK